MTIIDTATNIEDFITDNDPNYVLEALQKLKRDLRKAAKDLSSEEIRYIVSTYYTIQNYRIKSSNQVRQLGDAGQPIALLEWIFSSISGLENEVKKWMMAYADYTYVGQWALSITGIGPVIAAGLLANLDVTKSTNISKFWAFAGFDPTKKWERGQKRPWNAQLKVLGYKAGESFVKVQNNPSDVYGKLFRERKALYTARNEQGLYAERSAQILTERRIGKDTQAYEHYSSGHLPPAHIHAMARRWAVKIFLSHLWVIAYEDHYKMRAPDPWILTPMGGHSDRIKVPNHNCPYGVEH